MRLCYLRGTVRVDYRDTENGGRRYLDYQFADVRLNEMMPNLSLKLNSKRCDSINNKSIIKLLKPYFQNTWLDQPCIRQTESVRNMRRPSLARCCSAKLVVSGAAVKSSAGMRSVQKVQRHRVSHFWVSSKVSRFYKKIIIF